MRAASIGPTPAEKSASIPSPRAASGARASPAPARAASISPRWKSIPRPATSACTKIVAVHDCGLIINPLTVTSQINGGILCGLGYALYEERIMDRQTGLLLNTSFDSYKIANIADCPDIDVILIDMPERGVIGIGEPAVIPSGGAIANAVANAIGVRVHSLPITPAKILAALGKVPNTPRV